jgi:hypothetical protein
MLELAQFPEIQNNFTKFLSMKLVKKKLIAFLHLVRWLVHPLNIEDDDEIILSFRPIHEKLHIFV